MKDESYSNLVETRAQLRARQAREERQQGYLFQHDPSYNPHIPHASQTFTIPTSPSIHAFNQLIQEGHQPYRDLQYNVHRNPLFGEPNSLHQNVVDIQDDIASQ